MRFADARHAIEPPFDPDIKLSVPHFGGAAGAALGAGAAGCGHGRAVLASFRGMATMRRGIASALPPI